MSEPQGTTHEQKGKKTYGSSLLFVSIGRVAGAALIHGEAEEEHGLDGENVRR